MVWYLVGAVALFVLVRHLWRSYNHPAMVLTRQAANMNWVASGTFVDEQGLRNTKLTRDGLESIIWFKDQNVGLLKPHTERRFNNYVELERWLTSQVDGPVFGDEEVYFGEIEAFLRSCGYYEDIVLPAQCFEDFLKASRRVYRAGYKGKQSAQVVGALVADAANKFNVNPEFGLTFLRVLEKKI